MEDEMRADENSVGGELRKPPQKQWHTPQLRKLPIAATASGKGFGDEGLCGGKGDGGSCTS
jgi:hypothetical protein